MAFVLAWAGMHVFGSLAASGSQSQSSSFTLELRTIQPDSDSDGIPDAYESANGLNNATNDAAFDPDLDGLTNIEEYNAGTDPQVFDAPTFALDLSSLFTLDITDRPADTDGDGIPDYWETLHGLNNATNDAALNPDGDTLSNIEEYNAGTDPNVDDWAGPRIVASASITVNSGAYYLGFSTDTDGDDMPDWWEVKYGLNRLVNDAGGDLDSDGLSNLAEYLMGLNPTVDEIEGEVFALAAAFILDTIFGLPDRDGDGMRDYWETLYGLNNTTNDAALDPDEDGRTNLEEFNDGTDPNADDWRGPQQWASFSITVDTGGFNGGFALDSDSDGMPDWWEVQYGLSTNVNDSAGNPDGDGLTNIEEYNSGTLPNVFDWPRDQIAMSVVFIVDTGGQFTDSDFDGLPNWWERRYFGHDTNAIAVFDLDLDNLTNAEEYEAGTDPTNKASFFGICDLQKIAGGASGMTVIWYSVPSRSYTVCRSSAPGSGFIPVASNIVATPPLNTYTDSAPASAKAYYLIKTGL